MDLGKNIKLARAQKGLTQSELATITDVSSSVMSRYESGLKTPSLSVITRIAQATDKPVCWFYMDEAEQEKWGKDAQMSNEQVCQFAEKDEIEQKFALEALELFKKYTE